MMLPVEFQDEITHLFGQRRAGGDVVFVLDFAEALDPERLSAALRRLIDADPVLGCRLVVEGDRLEWRRRDDLDAVASVLVEHYDDPDPPLIAMLAPQPGADVPNIRVRLLRGPGGDRLIVAVSHGVADGAAARTCVQRLAEIYERLGTDPDWRPEPNPASRDSFAWARGLGWWRIVAMIGRDICEARAMARPCHGPQRGFDAFMAAPLDRPAFVRHVIPADRLKRLDAFAADRKVSRNDMLVAALARVFPAHFPGPPGAPFRVMLTHDLRRFAEVEPRPAVCNLGGVAALTLAVDPAMPPDAVLAAVRRAMAQARDTFSGVPNPLTQRLFARMAHGRKARLLDKMMGKGFAKPVAPVLTNVGRLMPGRFRFGGQVPVSMFLAGTANPLPLVVIAATEYAGTLSLSMSFQEGDLPREAVAALLAALADALPEA